MKDFEVRDTSAEMNIISRATDLIAPHIEWKILEPEHILQVDTTMVRLTINGKVMVVEFPGRVMDDPANFTKQLNGAKEAFIMEMLTDSSSDKFATIYTGEG